MRILGIDYGDARVGLAVSDPTGLLAGGIGTVNITGMNDAVKKIAKIALDNAVSLIVLGLPVNMDGSKGSSAEKISVFAKKLSLALNNMPYEFIDERRTTILAAQFMSETGTFGKKRKDSIDELSAQIILQTYLDRLKNADHKGNEQGDNL